MPLLTSTHTLPLLVTTASLIFVITGLLALLSVTASPGSLSVEGTSFSSSANDSPHASSLRQNENIDNLHSSASSLAKSSSTSSTSSSPAPSSSSETSVTDCPHDWHRFMNKCYSFNSTKVHSKVAKSHCESLNASMISIHTPEENEFIRRLIYIHYDSHLWIWLSRARNYNSTSQFTWLDGSSFDYTNWINPQSVDCSVCCEISLMPSGHWFASHCNSWEFAIGCQKVLTPSLLYTDEPIDDKHMKGNFYLSQFDKKSSSSSSNTIVSIDQIDPNVTELIDWLNYEVESIKLNINDLQVSNELMKNLQITSNIREKYFLILISFTITLLIFITFGLTIIYYKLNVNLKRLTNNVSPFSCDTSSIS